MQVQIRKKIGNYQMRLMRRSTSRQMQDPRMNFCPHSGSGCIWLCRFGPNCGFCDLLSHLINFKWLGRCNTLVLECTGVHLAVWGSVDADKRVDMTLAIPADTLRRVGLTRLPASTVLPIQLKGTIKHPVVDWIRCDPFYLQ